MDVVLRLFGRPEFTGEGAALHLRAERRYQLLAYLALRRVWVGRDALATLFWSEHDQASARRNLRKVLHDAYALAWAHGLEPQNDQLRWCVATDVEAADRALIEGRAGDALSWCRGPLLEGLDDTGSHGWTEWLDFERARWVDRRRDAALKQLAGLAPDAALALAEQLLNDDPLDEDLLAAKLRALLSLDRAHDAQRNFQTFAEALAEAHGTEPSAPLRQLMAQTQNLATAAATPEPPNVFVGRGAELQELQTLLLRPDCRLLVLTGPGGIGKSRLAKAALSALEPHFKGGVWWIPLDDLSDLSQVAPRVAQLLEIPLAGSDDPLGRVIEQLAARQALLVLDNAEHLSQLPALIERLLAQTPLKLLATSRNRPGVQGEWLLPVAGLGLPGTDAVSDPGDGVRLFAARSRAALPGFNLARHQAAVARLVQALGGMPLAIELAAHWVRLLPVAELADEVQQSLELLAQDDDGDERPEHRSVRATFDQSWRLLAPAEAQLLAALSMFAGSFTLPAARAVAQASVPLLAGLVDKSLLRTEPGGERSRFSLHPLLRQYAAEGLAQSPGALAATAAQHAAYYGRWLAERETALRGAEQAGVLAAIDIELPNCSAAWRHALAHRDAGFICGAAIALMYYFEAKGLRAEGLALMLAARDAFSGDDPAQATLGQAVSTLQYRGGDLPAAEASATRGIELARQHHAHSALKGCLLNLGLVRWQRGDWEGARALFEDGLQRARTDDDEHGVGVFVCSLAMVQQDLGDYAGAETNFREALRSARRTGNARMRVTTLSNLGQVLVIAERAAEALPVLEEGLQLCIDVGVAVMQSSFLLNLASAHLGLGHHDKARVFADRALSEWGMLGEPQAAVEALALLSQLDLLAGHIDAAHQRAHDGLRRATELEVLPLQAICVLALADVLAARGLIERAADLYALVQRHEATPAAVRTQAQRQQAALPAQLPTSTGGDGDLGDLMLVARELLREHPPAALGTSAD